MADGKHIRVTEDEKEVIDRYRSEQFNDRVTVGYALEDACRKALNGGDDSENNDELAAGLLA